GAVICNQAHYIEEWLTFHRLVGFERFIIALHRCSDETLSRIKSLPFSGNIITLELLGDEQFVQLGVYTKMVQEFGTTTRWFAFFDADEFMFPCQTDDMRSFMTEFESYGGLAVHNLEFGASNQVLKPDGLSIETFIYRASDHCYAHHSTKSIVDPKQVIRFLSPHLAETVRGLVTEDHVSCDLSGIWRLEKEPVFSRVRYNHYHTRSMEDWVERYRRGNCNDPNPHYRFDINRFNECDHKDKIDTEILRFADRLHRELQR
ncbi:MAG: glycosyltransferase family 2 protein, partial [Planctomycetaceae bacterium]|nr:glycosyltransferase family 2 protein [Planctomycetaceae bacterium]